ncbi:helix-turn-helix transcriptional regulator [Nocardioides sp.]|jgi:DNA-binding CsgD family transcriptional regulator|uniref:helix-turn-helix transcriptional regulator n=1 Tax=Nocardioides sp. TaxID=35761 RepID=UPI002B92D61C|nr:helix-turn-helix transcriptional regulator [Nocardioides sp.]HVX52909.1 helix-turn-helix transcriptional regulator [Nocardioides sp.]
MKARPGSTEAILEAVACVRDVARDAARGGAPAESLLSALAGVVPYDHASLARWDDTRRRHVVLAGDYAEPVAEHLAARLHEDPLFAMIRHPGGTLWLRDVPAELRPISTTIQEVLEPCGFEDGMTKCLFSRDGRYVGVLNLSLRHRRGPSRAPALALGLLDDCLAEAVAGAAQGVSDDGGAAVDSTVLVVPDRPAGAMAVPAGALPPDLRGAEAELADLVRRVAVTRQLPTTVLVPHAATLHELRLSRRGSSTVVVCSRAATRDGLSGRELQVLAQLTLGRTNPEIALRLHVSVRTVATHVEHLLAKLGLPNRAAAASRAAAWGLEPID